MSVCVWVSVSVWRCVSVYFNIRRLKITKKEHWSDTEQRVHADSFHGEQMLDEYVQRKSYTKLEGMTFFFFCCLCVVVLSCPLLSCLVALWSNKSILGIVVCREYLFPCFLLTQLFSLISVLHLESRSMSQVPCNMNYLELFVTMWQTSHAQKLAQSTRPQEINNAREILVLKESDWARTKERKKEMK